MNQSVDVRADYVSPSTLGTFYYCLGLQQNGGQSGNLSVVCGGQLAAKTTTMEISTTSASSTTRLSRPSSVVSSMEPTSAFNITNKDITKTTAAAVLSEDRKSESLVYLHNSLAIFVVISTISAILNIYFFINIRLRNKSDTKDDTNVRINHRQGNQSNAETYTELGNTVSGESENQYDSISRQENYINTNIL